RWRNGRLPRRRRAYFARPLSSASGQKAQEGTNDQCAPGRGHLLRGKVKDGEWEREALGRNAAGKVDLVQSVDLVRAPQAAVDRERKAEELELRKGSQRHALAVEEIDRDDVAVLQRTDEFAG